MVKQFFIAVCDGCGKSFNLKDENGSERALNFQSSGAAIGKVVTYGWIEKPEGRLWCPECKVPVNKFLSFVHAITFDGNAMDRAS
jgi:hypothetical protein